MFADLILDRRGTLPGARRDDARVALVIEGGGMRGVVSGGGVCALHDLGLTTCFDAIYGASAGAMNGTYLLAGIPHAGTRLYFEDLVTSRFIDGHRVLRGRAVMNLDDLIDRLMVEVAPLDEDVVREHPVPLHIVASSLKARGPIVLDERFGTLRERLRASARIPLFSGGPVTLASHKLIDGCVHEPLPVRRAFADGHTHVLVLRTRPRSAVNLVRTGALEKALLVALHVRHPCVWRTSVISTAEYLQQLAELDAWPDAGTVWALAPDGPEIQPHSMDAEAIRDCANQGYRVVAAAFGASRPGPFGR